MSAPDLPKQFASGFFSVAEMAAVLGRSRQAVEMALAGTAPDARIVTRLSKGQLAGVWRFERLPLRLAESLRALAARKGYRDAAHLISDPPKRWQSPFPLKQLAPRYVSRAVRLQSALRLALALQNEAAISDAERFQRGFAEFQRVMGKVSERHFRRLVSRTIERDAGEDRYDDAALYLDDDAVCAPDAKAKPVVKNDSERRVLDQLARVKNPAAPTVEERDLVWVVCCEEMYASVEAGAKLKPARRALVELLHSSPVALARNADALKLTLKRKYARWTAGGMTLLALADQRHENSGWHRAPVLSEQDRLALIAHARINCGGRESQAWRELTESGGLSHDLQRHYIANPASKSYVPQRIRETITPDVNRLAASHHGPREHQLRGAFHTRDWSEVAAGDWLTSDDVTPPVYFHTQTERGIELMRGQFLPMACERSGFILGFVLICERNYNSLAIRSLITRVCSEHGLPRIGFAFEKNIWQKSKILTGSKNALPWDVADQGLRSLGLRFRHANLPRGKNIENTIGLLQNQMEGLPGYCGRNEVTQKLERLQRAKLDVDAGRVTADEKFLSEQEITEAFFRIVERFNDTPQQGRKLPHNMTPREGWHSLQSSPRARFDGRCLHLLAHDCRKVKIGGNGITISIGKNRFNYKGGETGKRQGQEVLAWFNPDVPETLACTDLQRREVFTVERSYPLPAVGASREQLAEENAKIEAHNGYARRLYRVVKNELPSTSFRANLVDSKTAHIGAEIAAQREQITERKRTETQRRSRVTAKAARVGLPFAMLNPQMEETEKGLEYMRAALGEEAEADVPEPSRISTTNP